MSAEDMNDIEDMDIGYEDQSGPLFWSMKLEPEQSQEIDQPAIPGFIVHVTNASFGPQVNKGSRTVVMVNPSPEADDVSLQAPICVLRQGHHENHSLDLLFNESATISIKGQKPSPVYLTGYLQPPIVPEDENMMNPMFEDMDEEEIQRVLAEQRRQQKALDDEEDEDEDEEEEEPQLMNEDEVEPPTKKQKTASGAAKATKNGGKADKKRKSPQQKPKKSPQQQPAQSPLSSDDKKEEEKKKEDKKEKKKGKKDKKMQTMKGGIKFRDMKVGDGKVVSHGDSLRVYYVGQTDDKKVFDKCISGKGFEFNFGKGDVIKGWDMGLKGMRIGGKRKLIIPSKMAYGASGSPPSIPPNATLTFTIELKGVN